MTKNKENLTRREFNGRIIKFSAGIMVSPWIKRSYKENFSVDNGKVPVIVVKENELYSPKAGVIDQDKLQAMMDAGIRRLTGITDIGEAWKSIFPDITLDKIIGIKASCLARSAYPNTGLASHPEVANCIINGLTSMKFNGVNFPEENIIIWDRYDYELSNTGFTINKGETGVKCFGTSGITDRFDSTEYNVNGVTQQLSRILTDMTDYMINMSVFKNHTISGVTLSLKNQYGCCRDPQNMHDNACDPYIPALNILEPVRSKQVLCICDAILGAVSNGPSCPPEVIVQALLFSRDPVALDTVGVQMLNDLGSPTLGLAAHVATAAQPPYSLGVNDLSNIEVINIIDPSTGIIENKNIQVMPDKFRIFQNYPNPFNIQTVIAYKLVKPAKVRVDIYDINGRLIRKLEDVYKEAGYFRSIWNGKTDNELTVSSGTYFARFKIGKFTQAVRMTLVK